MDNYAVVKIGFDGTTHMVRVSIDEKNSGTFHTCFSEVVDLPGQWWQGAHVGISATTGQLADNHDILSVETVAGEGDPERVTQGESSEAAALQREETALFSRVAARHSVNEAALDVSEKGLLRVMEKLDQRQRLALGKLERELEHRIVGGDMGGDIE